VNLTTFFKRIIFNVLGWKEIYNYIIRNILCCLILRFVVMVLWWFEMHLFLYTWLECMVMKGPEGTMVIG
jgi:hypothetical protein